MVSRTQVGRCSYVCTMAICLVGMIPMNSGFAQQWQSLPMVSQLIKDAGHFGGEGCQWPLAIEVDQVDAQFLLFGTDVGGVYRSIDGGAIWEPANVGLNARGACDFAIDPHNTNYALAVACNSTAYCNCHGIYLTRDKAATWSNTLAKGNLGYRDTREQVAYDPSSYNPTNDRTMIAYWAMENDGIYKTTDGGESWFLVNDSYGSSWLRVHPAQGYVYVGNGSGFYKSTDGGSTFVQKVSGSVRSVDVIASLPDRVYMNMGDGLYLSDNSGENFSKVSSTNYPTAGPLNISVSPADPNRLVLVNDEGTWNLVRYYSHNGGASWQKAGYDNTYSWVPYNNRRGMFAWHPDNPAICWSLGGDYVTRSTNGGAIWTWDSNGYTGIMIGGMFNFSVQDPDVIFYASQDYNAGLTTDDGYLWKYCNISGNSWGGFAYAGYALNADIMWGGNADSWGGSRILRISYDGGNSFINKGITAGGSDVSYADPTDSSVLFFSNYRSADQGGSWQTMSNCRGVFTSNPSGSRELYGLSSDSQSIVRSFDHGVSWQTVCTFPSGLVDIALDQLRGRVYGVTGGQLYYGEGGVVTDITGNVPVDQFGNRRLKTVAVDPVDTNVVYVGGSGDVYANDAAVVRSLDAGGTWEILTRNIRTGNTQFGKDGGRECACIRVHPVNRYAYVFGQCFGLWRFPPPGQQLLPPGDLAAQAVDGHSVHLAWTDNSDDEDGFIVQRKPCNRVNQWHEVAVLPENSTEYLDTDSIHGYVLYTYRVGAFKN